MSKKIFTSNKLEIQSNTINQIARWYFEDELQIYPSKLIWSLDEKKIYIDSFYSYYPVSFLILVSI